MTFVLAVMMWSCVLLPGAATGPVGDDVGPASPGPDLTASSSDIGLSDSSPRQGQTVSVQLTVRNVGDQGAFNVSVELYDGDSSTGSLIKQWAVPSIGVNGTTTLSATWTAVLGDRDLTMYLDPDDWIAEDNESNNVVSKTVTVAGVPDVRLEGGAFVISGNEEGQVTLTADVYNGGQATATGCKVGFYVGDPEAGGSLIGRSTLPDIPAGGRATAHQSWSANEGTHHLYVRLEDTDSMDPSANDAVDRKVWIAGDVTSRAGPDLVAYAGQNLTFNGSASWATGGAIANYTWDLGDGSFAYGAVVTHAYTNTGTTVRTLTARLNVKDGSGGTDSDTCRVYINPQSSSPPVADAGTPPSGTTLVDLAFNGSGSTGNINTYIWDLGDGTGTTGVAPVHAYMDDGTYTVSLVVLSTDSLAGGDVIQVTVSNQPPAVTDIADISTDVGVSQDLVVLATDADGYIASYSWDFGDGSTSSVRDPTHTWTSDGPHQCSVNVTDDDGAYTVVGFWVNVTDVAPVAFFTAQSPRNEGQTVRVDGSYTSEPGDDIVKWEWDWESDGTYDNTTGPVSQVIYEAPGYYNITLKVTDGEGSTNETVRMVEIRNVAPTVTCTRDPTSVMEGENVTFNASASSEPGDDIVRYYFDWDGDGTYDFNTTESIVNHTYTAVGTFTVSVMAEDEDGTFGTWSAWTYYRRVTVSNAPPLVNETWSYGKEGENTTIHVDAYEPGNNLVEFWWDFDGDYVVDINTSEPYVNYTFWEAGVHTVWVKVYDEDHTEANPSWGGGEVYINITDVAPQPSVEGGMAEEGAPTAFTVVMKGSEQNISTFEFDVDGDGDFDVSSTDWTTELVFTDTGELECLVRVVDTDGTEGIALFNVFVTNVAPTVTGPALLVTSEGESLTVTVKADEPGMDIVRYEFDWNADGIVDETSLEPTASHMFVTPGAKRIVVLALDEDESRGSTGLSVLVYNAPPEADAGTPAQTFEGVPTELNASGSTEPGGHIVVYEWDYDADGLFDHSTREPVHMHAWDTPGLHTIVVRVVDADGTFDEDTATVVVEDAPPVASLVVDPAPEDRPTVLDASSSSDPGGIATYVWNITSTGQRFDVETDVPYLEFTFDRYVRYDIKLTVIDDEGTSSVAEHTVMPDDVQTLAPEVGWMTPSLVMEGQAFSLRAWATDPFPDDPDLAASRLIEYSWAMGDGVTVLKGASVVHTYAKAEARPFEVWLTVVDEDGDETHLMVANISVMNPAPEVSPVTPIVVKAGGSGDTTVEAVDGTTPSAELVFTLDPASPEWVAMAGNKLTAEPGKGVDGATYLVAVTVTDGLGASTTTQVAVVVTADAEEAGVGMTSVLGLMLLAVIIAVVLAVLIVSRMRPPGGASREKEKETDEYAKLYGEEPARRKVRAVAKVESEKVDVEPPAEDAPATTVTPAPDYVAAAAAAGFEVEEPDEPSEPPMPSWMSSTKAGEVQLEEKAVESPPATPPEWSTPPAPDQGRSYGYRGPEEGKQVAYKGAGRPK